MPASLRAALVTRLAIAVNCLLTEPSRNAVRTVFGARACGSASPNAAEYDLLPRAISTAPLRCPQADSPPR